MANQILSELGKRLPQIALGILAARQGGPQAAAAFQQGLIERQQAEQARTRQTQLDEERRQATAAQETRARSADERAASAEARAAEDQQLQRVNSLMSALSNYDADPSALASLYNVPADQVNAIAAPIVSARKKKRAKERLDSILSSPLYKGYTQTPEGLAELDEQNVELDGSLIKVRELRQMAEQTVTPKVAPPNTDKRGLATKDITVDGKRMLSGWDPDTNQYYAPGDTKTPLTGDIQEYQKPDTSAASGLTPRQQQQALSQARTFETLGVVKNTQKISEAVAFVNGLDLNTKNPADDQALIYAFAKAMDPDSVVREGEYATVQKYSQSWLESFGFNAQRILSNAEFLTPQARANLKRTILTKFNAARPQYDAVRKSYVGKINKITGQMDGEDWLTDYGAAFPTADTGNTKDVPAGARGGLSYQKYLDSRKGPK